jgi:flagellar hook assembly protein FlgD
MIGGFSLRQNYPNPFNPTTTISFHLQYRASVELAIYDTQGKLVKKLIDQALGEGQREVIWDATDARGIPVASGIYFYRLRAGGQSAVKRMVFLK